MQAYVSKEEVEGFVVGLPVQMNNLPSDSVRFVEPFIKKLKKTFPDIPVMMIDERFTSKIAKQTIIDGGIKKQARRNKEMVDKISAVIILQSFLDQN